MKAVVLAGGLGTRLRERVPDLPKPMAPVSGRPFLSHLLDHLVDSGVVASAILSVGYRADVIRQHFGTQYRGLPLQYAVEPEPLGTGGALALALQGLGDEPVLAFNGDTLLRVNLSDLTGWYALAPEPLAMVLRQVPDAGRYGAVQVRDGRVVGFLERGVAKPGLVNAGVYLLRRQLFGSLELPHRYSFEIDVLQAHCTSLKPRAFVTEAYFIDIGIPADLDRADAEMGASVPPP